MNRAVYSEELGTGAAIMSSRSSERKKVEKVVIMLLIMTTNVNVARIIERSLVADNSSEHLFGSEVRQCLYKDDVYHRPQNRDQSGDEKVSEPVVSGSSKAIAQFSPAGSKVVECSTCVFFVSGGTQHF